MYTKDNLSEGVTRNDQQSVGRPQLFGIWRTLWNVHITTERKCERALLMIIDAV